MDYCTTHFGKTLESVNLEDIESFFAMERMETDQLEFKSINPNGTINEMFPGIQRSVCAFLNSSGGLIIWGAPRGHRPDGRTEKVFTGDPTFFSQVLEKDFVISKLSDAIIPLPNSVRTKIIESNSRCLVLFEIDESEYTPHQTGNTYFMRIDGQTRPAPHHYIEALFKKIKYPNIEAYLKITHAQIRGNLYQIQFDLYFFNWSPLQNEEQLSFRVIAENGIFLRSQIPESPFYRLNGAEFFKDPVKDIFYFGEPVREADTLVFNPLRIENNRALILITFGGRFSPRKSSEYTLDFSHITSDNPGDIITSKKENRLAKDSQDEIGVNKQEIIDSLLRRG